MSYFFFDFFFLSFLFFFLSFFFDIGYLLSMLSRQSTSC